MAVSVPLVDGMTITASIIVKIVKVIHYLDILLELLALDQTLRLSSIFSKGDFY
jgi:hypothetical protein